MSIEGSTGILDGSKTREAPQRERRGHVDVHYLLPKDCVILFD